MFRVGRQHLCAGTRLVLQRQESQTIAVVVSPVAQIPREEHDLGYDQQQAHEYREYQDVHSELLFPNARDVPNSTTIEDSGISTAASQGFIQPHAAIDTTPTL